MPARGWVVVTGASRGIGRAIADTLAGDGFGIVALARSLDELAELQSGHAPGLVRIASADIGDADRTSLVLTEACCDLPCLEGVVLNAGIGEWGSIAELSTGAWSSMFRTNVDGPFNVLQLSLPLLRRAAHPQVVSILSDSVEHVSPTRAGYCASKSALSALTETLRREERSTGIRVTAINPGRVDSYFRNKRPGARPNGLRTEEVSAVVGWVFNLPRHVEIRRLDLASMHDTFGPYPEALEKAEATNGEI